MRLISARALKTLDSIGRIGWIFRQEALVDPSREQILVVDDEEELRNAIVEILTHEGFEVDHAATAEEAAEKLAQTAYDVLITDHNLPGRSGLELLEESLIRYPEIISIII